MSTESAAILTDRALALYKPPFKFVHGYIQDANHQNMADNDGGEANPLRVRGWGRIQKFPNAEALQDHVGELIAAALTEYWERRAAPVVLVDRNAVPGQSKPLTKPQLRALVYVLGCGVQDDQTAQWEFTDAGLMKLLTHVAAPASPIAKQLAVPQAELIAKLNAEAKKWPGYPIRYVLLDAARALAAAPAVQDAPSDEQIRLLREMLSFAVSQNECDMLMTGEECRKARKVLERVAAPVSGEVVRPDLVKGDK